MMVNNWFVIAGACILVTTEYSAIFFICFFVIVNLIVLNILIALILESSQAVREELHEPIELDLTLEDAQQLPGMHRVSCLEGFDAGETIDARSWEVSGQVFPAICRVWSLWKFRCFTRVCAAFQVLLSS
ncbi:unnamed protein product [Symbiodinium sp. CCMP2456]|nr:unnamed protein product [Symbiodinium sp. CCMP2456]